MGVRIDIEWDFVSPLLRVASGIARVWDIEHISQQHDLILQCRCHIEQGSNGFKGMEEHEGVSVELFNIYGETIRAMMKGFFDGMILRDKQYHWIEESLHGQDHFQKWIDLRKETEKFSGA